ncbi:hypothetical protein [Streptomyces canus]|uniref:hypothetical protein n=1 Tax=Streptomyces canus TaxID=58343 RepID=UPI002F90D9C3
MELHQWIFAILATLLTLLAGFILNLAQRPYHWGDHAKYFGGAAAAAALGAVLGLLASNQWARDSKPSSDDRDRRTAAQVATCTRTEKVISGMVVALQGVKDQVATRGDGDNPEPVDVLTGYRGSVAHEKRVAEELGDSMASYTAAGLTFPSKDDPAHMISDLGGMLTRLPSEIASKKNYRSDWEGLWDRQAHFTELAKALSAKCSTLSAT